MRYNPASSAILPENGPVRAPGPTLTRTSGRPDAPIGLCWAVETGGRVGRPYMYAVGRGGAAPLRGGETGFCRGGPRPARRRSFSLPLRGRWHGEAVTDEGGSGRGLRGKKPGRYVRIGRAAPWGRRQNGGCRIVGTSPRPTGLHGIRGLQGPVPPMARSTFLMSLPLIRLAALGTFPPVGGRLNGGAPTRVGIHKAKIKRSVLFSSKNTER